MNFFQKRQNIFIFANLSCEIFYVFLKRLRETNFQESKIKEIISKFVKLAFSYKHLQKLGKFQRVFTLQEHKDYFWSVFKIFRVIERSSFERLFEIALLVVKKNLMLLVRPEEMVLLTKNHFEGIFLNIKKTSQFLELEDLCMQVISKLNLKLNLCISFFEEY